MEKKDRFWVRALTASSLMGAVAISPFWAGQKDFMSTYCMVSTSIAEKNTEDKSKYLRSAIEYVNNISVDGVEGFFRNGLASYGGIFAHLVIKNSSGEFSDRRCDQHFERISS